MAAEIHFPARRLEESYRKPLSATLLTDFDLNIIEMPGELRSFYGIGWYKDYKNVRNLVESRASLGWVSWSECFETHPSLEARLREVSATNHLSTFQVSPSGEIAIVSHTKLQGANKIAFNFLNTGVSINRSRKNKLNLAQEIITALAEEYSGFFGAWWPDFYRHFISNDTMFAASRDGRIFFSRIPQKDKHSFNDVTNIRDLPLDYDKVIDQLDRGKQSRLFFEAPRAGQVLLDANLTQAYPGGVELILISLRRCDHLSVTRDILTLHPNLTRKEAEVLAGLAAGKPIKSIAEHLGKSKVTVGLQARSAMHKLGLTNLNALQTHVLVHTRFCRTP